MVYFALGAVIAVLAAVLLLERKGQRRLLNRIQAMTEEARAGTFSPESMDESLISSVENDVAQFLKETMTGKESLQEQKEAIQTLISDISHQTTTPLSNIMIYSQLLEELLAGKEGREQAAVIREQAEKLDFLIKSLVKTSRLETGVIKTSSQICDLAELAESVAEQGRQKALAKGISLEFIRPGETVRAFCDPKWTREALWNLLDNGIKYTPAGGSVTLSITAYSLFARIDVRDSGMGIAEEELPKVFGRFYRSQTAAEQEGVGLGLYLARRIAESEGGYIKVSSKAGAGSCFSLFLPEAEIRPQENLTEV